MDRVETHIGSVAHRRAGAGAPLVRPHGGSSDGRSLLPGNAGPVAGVGRTGPVSAPLTIDPSAAARPDTARPSGSALRQEGYPSREENV
jgi:hypothetical protein